MLVLIFLFFNQFAFASDIQMATSEDLKEFDTLIKQEPPKKPAPHSQNKKMNPREGFQGQKNPDQKLPPPNPFDQRPPPGAGAPGDGHLPPPPGGGNPRPPPPPPH